MTAAFIVAGAIPLALSVAIAIAHAIPARPRRAGRWASPPVVWYTYALPAEYRVALAEAVGHWRARGHDIGPIAVWTNPGRPHHGILVDLRGRRWNENHLGLTEWFIGNDGVIEAALVQVPSGLGDQAGEVLEHELGHALGFRHVQRHGHLMSARSGWVGKDASGLEGP